MFAKRKPTSTDEPNLDRFRGTTQRWTIDAGPLAGTTYDHTFHDDWSVSWRVLTGESQGRFGRARQFYVQPVRADLYLLHYAVAQFDALTVTLDFAAKRLAGFKLVAGTYVPVSGAFQTL